MASAVRSRSGTRSLTRVADDVPDSLVARSPRRKASSRRAMKAKPPARLMSRERSIEKAGSS
jgi:hypothetical protein